MGREPALIIGFLATIIGEVAAVVTPDMDWRHAVVAALPVISSAAIRYFVSPSPPDQRGVRRR